MATCDLPCIALNIDLTLTLNARAIFLILKLKNPRYRPVGFAPTRRVSAVDLRRMLQHCTHQARCGRRATLNGENRKVLFQAGSELRVERSDAGTCGGIRGNFRHILGGFDPTA